MEEKVLFNGIEIEINIEECGEKKTSPDKQIGKEDFDYSGYSEKIKEKVENCKEGNIFYLLTIKKKLSVSFISALIGIVAAIFVPINIFLIEFGKIDNYRYYNILKKYFNISLFDKYKFIVGILLIILFMIIKEKRKKYFGNLANFLLEFALSFVWAYIIYENLVDILNKNDFKRILNIIQQGSIFIFAIFWKINYEGFKKLEFHQEIF